MTSIIEKYPRRNSRTRGWCHRTDLHLVTLILAIVLVYWGLWRCYFFFDDFWMLGWVRFKPDLWEGSLTQIHLGYALRPFLDANLWIRTQLFGLNPAPYYFVSLVQHYCVAALLYCIARELYGDKQVAWLGVILFGTTFAANSVVNWITGSNYTLAYLLGLSSLLLFIRYRRNGQQRFLLLSLSLFVITLSTAEAVISILPLFILYDLLVALPRRQIEFRTKKLISHLLYVVWLMPYLALQATILVGEGSEYGGKVSLGIHNIKSFVNLVYMVIPNFSAAPIRRFLDSFLPSVWFDIGNTLAFIILFLLIVAGIFMIVKGAWADRFLVAWMLITFLPFALWDEPGLAAADRYLYLPAAAFFVLLARSLAVAWRASRYRIWRALIPIFITGLLILNLVFHQTWIKQQITNGNIKRATVEQLVRDFPEVPEDTEMLFIIPESNFQDIAGACTLIYRWKVNCWTTVEGEMPSKTTDYLLRVNENGFEVVSEGKGYEKVETR